MNVLIFLVPAALALGLIALYGLFWSLKRDQYEDLEGAAYRILRDDDRHIEQLARALETGQERFVTDYGEHIVPIYRRRDIRMNDYVTILGGLREAALSVLPGEDAGPTTELIDRWIERVRHHRRLAGDHKGNSIVRLIWKGAGLGDDTVV